MADDLTKNSTRTGTSYSRTTSKGPDIDAVEPADDSEVKSIQGQIQALKRQTVSPVDYTQVNQLEQDAKDLYDNRASRAEWMGVAERVGNALVKLGAAGEARKAGVDVSRVQDVAPTDWEKSIDRYGQDYRTELGRADKKRQDLKETVRENQSILDKQYEDQSKALAGQADFAKYQYGQGSQDYRQYLRDQAAHSREMERIAFQEGNMNAREDRRDKSASDAQDRQLRMLQAQDLQKQIAESQSREKSASEAANALSMEDDLSAKSVGALETKLPGVLGRAGVSPETLDNIQKRVEKTEPGDPTKPGLVYGENRDEDLKKRQLLQQTIVQPQVEKTATLRKALDEVLRRGGSSAPLTPRTPDTIQKQGQDLVKEMAPPAMSDQDKQALAWAKANPTDPRSAAIISKLSGK